MIYVDYPFIVWSFFFFFFFLWAAESERFRWLLANGLKTLTSAYATCPFTQKLLAATSALASFVVIAELSLKVSPVSGWRSGSTITSGLTSFRIPADWRWLCRLLDFSSYSPFCQKSRMISALYLLDNVCFPLCLLHDSSAHTYMYSSRWALHHWWYYNTLRT